MDPKEIVWEYTLKCNSKCLHCGSDALSSRDNELSSDEVLNLVDQIAEIGFKRIVLAGGEPTLRKDWQDTAFKIKDKGIDFGIISNALAWKSEIIDNLATLDPYAVGLSVDGERELHDYIRGVPGSHEKVFSSVKQLKAKGVTVCAVTAVNKKNLLELPQIRNRLIIYGIDAWQLQTASPMGRMADNMDLVLNADDYYQFAKFIVETREKVPHMNIAAGDCVGYFGSLEKGLRDQEWQGCMAGIQGMGIDSDGTVRGCLSIRSDKAKEGNVRDSSLKEIWEGSRKFKYNREFNVNNLKGDCTDCDYGIKCKGGCQSQSTAFFDEFHNAPYCIERYEKR